MSSEFKIREARISDLESLLFLEKQAWPEEARASRDTYLSRLEIFPEGIIIAEGEEGVLGAAVTEIVDLKTILKSHFSWSEITDNGSLKKTHNSQGDCIYGVNLSVKPSSLGEKVGIALMDAIKAMIVMRDLKMGALGGRMPSFAKYIEKNQLAISDEVAREYIFARTNSGKFRDPEIGFYDSCDLEIIRPLSDYFPDPDSSNYGVLIIWRNPKFVLFLKNLL